MRELLSLSEQRGSSCYEQAAAKHALSSAQCARIAHHQLCRRTALAFAFVVKLCRVACVRRS